MGFRFRKSVRLFPGVRVNFSTHGMSVSAGVPGATLNFGTRGSSVTVGIPGSGISFRQQLGTTPRRRAAPAGSPGGWRSPNFVPDSASPVPGYDGPLPGEIRSAEVASLTSPDLQGLKTLINEAARQKADLKPDFAAAIKSRRKAWRKLCRREQPPLSLFMKSSIPTARAAFEDAEQEALKVVEALAASEIKVDVVLDAGSWVAWSRVEAAHKALATSQKFWDVTSSVWIDRVKKRSAAHSGVTRKRVGLRPITDGTSREPVKASGSRTPMATTSISSRGSC